MNDINDKRNFLPRFLLKPEMEKTDCIGWGLSFFDTNEAAKKRLKEIVGYRKNLFKKLGTHVAVGNLDAENGLSDKAQSNGHFTHFEYKDVSFSMKFNIIEKVQ